MRPTAFCATPPKLYGALETDPGPPPPPLPSATVNGTDAVVVVLPWPLEPSLAVTDQLHEPLVRPESETLHVLPDWLIGNDCAAPEPRRMLMDTERIPLASVTVAEKL